MSALVSYDTLDLKTNKIIQSVLVVPFVQKIVSLTLVEVPENKFNQVTGKPIVISRNKAQDFGIFVPENVLSMDENSYRDTYPNGSAAFLPFLVYLNNSGVEETIYFLNNEQANMFYKALLDSIEKFYGSYNDYVTTVHMNKTF